MTATMTLPDSRAVAALVSERPSVSLGQLDSCAALLTRVDRKYPIAIGDATAILDQLPADTAVLEIDGRRSHSYRSQYFDTPNLVSFMGAARPRRRRFKVRTRGYVDTGDTFLEVKTRGPRGATVKERRPIGADVALCGVLPVAEEAWVASRLASLGLPEGIAAELRPALEVSYTRTTLLLGDAGTRATIDTDLSWRAPDGRSLDIPGLCVVETKSGSSPSSLDHLLWSCGHRATRFSKYATALTAIYPALPANRWARTLRSLFIDEGATSRSFDRDDLERTA